MRVILASRLKLFTDELPLGFAVGVIPPPFLDARVMNLGTDRWELGLRSVFPPRCILRLEEKKKKGKKCKDQKNTSFKQIQI